MLNLEGRTAVVTGGGSGIGRGIVLAAAGARMTVVVADVETARAEEVAHEARGLGATAIGMHVDVTDRASMCELAERVAAEAGAVHLLCNNAGVFTTGALDAVRDEAWDWVLSVNLKGVVNGLQAFVPRMRLQSGEKHIVNTASLAGHIAVPGLGIYNTSKFAVVGLSETLRADLAPHGFGVSVLCPGLVATNIVDSTRNRPASLGGHEAPAAEFATRLTREGMDPLRVGELVLRGVREDELYIFTHPEARAFVEGRMTAILEAFDRWSNRVAEAAQNRD